jgi:hypothetical protein
MIDDLHPAAAQLADDFVRSSDNRTASRLSKASGLVVPAMRHREATRVPDSRSLGHIRYGEQGNSPAALPTTGRAMRYVPVDTELLRNAVPDFRCRAGWWARRRIGPEAQRSWPSTQMNRDKRSGVPPGPDRWPAELHVYRIRSHLPAIVIYFAPQNNRY